MFKERDDYIKNLGKEPSFQERRWINWAFRYLSGDKLQEYLDTKIGPKKEEKTVKAKNNKEEVI